MFTNLSLRTKIFFLVSGVVIAAFVVLTVIVSNEAYELAKRDAFCLAQETADKYNNEIKFELQGSRITAETLATVFETLKSHNLTDRKLMNDLLKNALVKKEYITAFCTAYDPDALDGKDKEFVSGKIAVTAPDGKVTEFDAYDNTGRFAPYWNKLGESIAVEFLPSIDTEDWYIEPKKTLHEYITDPYPYGLQGRTVMLASLIFPIVHDNKFIGIISSDIVLDKLQEMVSKVNPHEQGGYTSIFSNAGLIVAHPEKQNLSKDFAEVLAYHLVTTNKKKAGEAVQLAEKYLAANIAANTDEDKVKTQHGYVTFVEQVKKYVENSFGNKEAQKNIDLTLLTPELANVMLQADPDLAAQCAEVKAAVKDGKPYISSDGANYMVFMPVQFSAVTKPWSVAVCVPMTTILSSAERIRNDVIMTSVIAILVIALVLYVISRNVTRPILRLAGTAKILGEGNFNAEVPVVNSRDEIGTLASAFKVMVGKINTLITELQGNARTLEEKNVSLNDLNAELKAAIVAAGAANKAKSLFLANISHELRTPLNAVIGLTRLLRNTSMDKLQQDYTDKMNNASASLLGIINNIIDFSDIDAGKMKLNQTVFNIRQVCSELNGHFQQLYPDSAITQSFELDTSVPENLLGDELRLKQILVNLLDNSYKFTAAGSITVKVNVERRDPLNVLLQFTVTDTGIGMSNSVLEKIFDAFNQADNSATRRYGGTGIGLTITREIVTLMGGNISVASEEGKGTTFTFTCSFQIPEGKGDRTRAERIGASVAGVINGANTDADNADANAVLKGMHVLLVEDNKINAMIAEALLTNVGITVTPAENGQIALDRLAEAVQVRKPAFDLILMDLQMPVMDGYEATKIIKEAAEYKDIPVFALTAHAFAEERERCKNLGMEEHLVKPVDVDQFYKSIRGVVE